MTPKTPGGPDVAVADIHDVGDLVGDDQHGPDGAQHPRDEQAPELQAPQGQGSRPLAGSGRRPYAVPDDSRELAGLGR